MSITRNGFQGLVPVSKANDNLKGALHPMWIPASDSTAMFRGDPVTCIVGTSGDSNAITVPDEGMTGGAVGLPIGSLREVKLPTLATNNPITGVINSFGFGAGDGYKYRPASVNCVALGYVDPDIEYEIVADGPLAVVDSFATCNLVQGAPGDTAYGTSGVGLDASEIDANAQDQVLLLFASRDRHRRDLSAANPKYIVKINNYTDRAIAVAGLNA